jgi:hypothetical protein
MVLKKCWFPLIIIWISIMTDPITKLTATVKAAG